MNSESLNSVVTASAALEWLGQQGSETVRADMGPKYGIHTPQSFGVPMKQMKALAKQLGTSHGLAAELWESGWYEARAVASMVDDPALVTAQQMDRWCEEFDNWAIVDTVCFNLFDRTAHAWEKVDNWCTAEGEFQKRASFALLWSLALHDKTATDGQFVSALELVEREAHDERKYVAKSVSMALRAIAHRSPALAESVTQTAKRLEGSSDPSSRSIGKRFLRESARHN